MSLPEDGFELFVHGRGVVHRLAEEFFVRPESRADVLARAEAEVAGARTERRDDLLLLAARSGGIVPVDELHIEIQKVPKLKLRHGNDAVARRGTSHATFP